MKVIQTYDGGLAIGTADWQGDENRRDRDYLIIKTDSIGEIEWQEFYTLDPDTLRQNEQFHGIVQLPDSGFVLVGTGTGGPGSMIVRTDAAGEMIFSREYQPNQFAQFTDCVLSEDENIVVTTYGTGTMLDSENGDVIWSNNYFVEGSGEVWQVANSNEGGYLLTGRISSIGAGSSDIYAVKIDADGEELWRTILLDDEDNILIKTLYALTETPDGGFACINYVRDNVRLIRIDEDGTLIWSTQYYVRRITDVYSILLMEDFGYLLGGFGPGDILIRTEPDSLNVLAWDLQSDNDSLAFEGVPIDSTSVIELTLTNEADYPVWIHDIFVDSSTFTVEFEDFFALDAGEEVSIPVTFSPTDSSDYAGILIVHTTFGDVVVKLSGTGTVLSVPEEPKIPLEFELADAFPNPFNNTTIISFSIPEDSEIRLSVYNLTGRLVQELSRGHLNAGQHSVAWNAGSIAAGS